METYNNSTEPMNVLDAIQQAVNAGHMSETLDEESVSPAFD